MIERLDEYVDLQAIERQTEATVKQIELVISAFERLQKQAVKNAKAIKSPDVKAPAAKPATLPEAQANYDESNKLLEEEKRLQAELEAGQKRINALKAKAAQLSSEQATEEAKLKIQNQQIRKEVELSARADLAKVGSLEAMKIELSQLTSQYDKLNATERESPDGKARQERIAGLTQEIKDAEFALNNFRRNVGNYEGASQSVRQEIVALRSEMVALAKSGQQDSEEFRQMNARLSELHRSISNYDDGVKSVRGEMMMLKNELVNLRLAGKSGTEEFRMMEERLGNLTDTLQDVNTRAKVLGSDEGALEGVTMALGGMAGAFEAVQGAQAMFGAENEDIQKLMLRVQASIAMTNGIMAVAKAINKDSASAVIINAYAHKFYNAIVGQSTGALKGFKLALAGTGIGAIILLLGYLISHWEEVTAAISGYTRQQQIANDVSKKANEEAAAQVARLKILREALVNEKSTRDQRNSALREFNTLADAGNQLDEKSLSSTTLINAAIDKQIALTYKRAEAKAYEDLLTKKIQERADKELELANKMSSIANAGFVRASFNATFGNESAGMVQLSDQIKKLGEDADWLTKQAYKLNIDSGSAEDAKAKIDQIKQTRQVEVENIQSSVTRATELRRLQFEEEVKNAGTNEELKKQLTIKYERDRSDIQRDYSKKQADIERQTAESLTQLRLSLMTEGIEKEKAILINEATTKKQSLSDQLKYEKELSGATRQNISNTILEIDKKLKQDQEALDLKYYQESVKINNELISIEAERYKTIIDDETQTIDQRVSAQQNYEDLRIATVRNSYALEIEAAGTNSDQIKLLEKKQAAEIEAIRREGSSTIRQLAESEYKKQESIAENHLKVLSSTEEIALNDQYSKGIISKKEYERRKLEIANKYAKQELELQLRYLALQLMATSTSAEKKAEIMAQISELHKKLSEIELDETKTKTEGQVKLEEWRAKSTKEKLEEVASGVGQLIGSIAQLQDQVFKNRLTQLDVEKEKNQANMEKELEQAGDNETKKNEIKQKYAALDKKAEKERRKIEHDRAVAAKKFAIFEIILNTAMAVVKAAPVVPLMIMSAVIGAAQLAVATSQKIPEYAVGRKTGPAELAVVGEKGREIIRHETGEMYLTPDRPTLTYLPARAEVIPHDKIESRILLQEAFENRTLTTTERMQLVQMEGGDFTRIIAEAVKDPESVNTRDVFTSEKDQQKADRLIERLIIQVNNQKAGIPMISPLAIRPEVHTKSLASISRPAPGTVRQYDFRKLEKRIENLTEVVRNKRETYISITKSGVQKLEKDGASWREYINEQIHG